jgi:hypothetical protein
MRRYQLLRGGLFAVLCLAATGCGSKLVHVKGKVLLDGKPVEKATVVFEHEDGGGNQAAAQTDDEGVFHLGTFQPGDGAMPGQYKVLIIPPGSTNTFKVEGEGMAAALAAVAKWQEENRKNPQRGFGWDIAAKYRNPAETPLRQTVPATGPVVFEVTVEPGAGAKKRPAPAVLLDNPMEPPKRAKKR